MDNLATKLQEELETLCGSLGRGVKPYKSIEQLQSLKKPDLEKLLRILNIHRRAREMSYIEGLPTNEDWFRIALKEFNLRTVDNVQEKFDDGDIIEIYDTNLVQLSHNMVFHLYCSYDFTTLITEPIFELYSRPTEITELMVKRVTEIIKFAKKTEPWNVPLHGLREIKLGNTRAFGINLKWISPLLDDQGNTVAFVSTNHCIPGWIHAV